MYKTKLRVSRGRSDGVSLLHKVTEDGTGQGERVKD